MLLSRYVALSPLRRRALLRAVFWVPILRLALRVLPFRIVRAAVARIADWQLLRRPLRNQATSAASGTVEPARSVEAAAWAVEAAGRRLGGACLPRALAAEILLAGLGEASALRIGVTVPCRDRLTAHAWLEWRGRTIVGSLSEISRYHVLSIPAGRWFPRKGG